MSRPKVIAFYLPQFHPTPHNDEWWGKGFTEWTNVGKAKPLFWGHYQPKVPADLGYYDLRLSEVREAQAELAREAGIYGFCYYHYWFGDGKEELELPFDEVLRLGKPDIPFMLCWANESWHKKFWNKDGIGTSKQVLVEQTYPGEQDIINHFYRLLPAFKDPRYIRIDGKPAFMIYKSELLQDVVYFIQKWNDLAKLEGLDGIYFMTQVAKKINKDNLNSIFSLGFNGINILRLWENDYSEKMSFKRIINKIKRDFFRKPIIRNYNKLYPLFIGDLEIEPNIYPTIIPNWDHSPRSGINSYILVNSTPDQFKKHCEMVFEKTQYKSNNIVFLKSWNEWGEGNYLEPDLKYGKGFIYAIREALELYLC
ncbi:glycoside hydrolase family 99-like domain-containing protein [Duncaniella freteri]|uniref:glycosyltransferase WbsX family protein n=2 Tax=Duncaniella TaxID=2518495 RepID=UPI00256FF310|nr:glycoside hydrolase family 99-like domain-containing protein [Duncaniella freteri]